MLNKCPSTVTTGEHVACWDGRWDIHPPRHMFHTAQCVGTVVPPGSLPGT